LVLPPPHPNGPAPAIRVIRANGDPVPERRFDFEPQRGPRPNCGFIGLQDHKDNDVVFLKEVSIAPLKKTAVAAK
jgi:hypothetical protein